ncbi:MAG: CHASE domain-containing protein [Kiritimatiellia bacterium]
MFSRESETITQSEFAQVTAHIVRDYSIQTVTWSPATRRDEVDAFETSVRASGMQAYRVWRNAETNRPRRGGKPVGHSLSRPLRQPFGGA